MTIITKDMSIIEVAQKYPQTIEVFASYGMGCLGCVAARFENIEQGANGHGIDADALVADLNKAVQKA
ncbi:MAG: hybrid cluSPTER protein-associated redox disulfide domain protein [Firmicutes bacterium]|nr:hybrid cluSPTER protein-associated redox disulfide domain protein [Bacillota bacterium]